jgi:hypothetical protein
MAKDVSEVVAEVAKEAKEKVREMADMARGTVRGRRDGLALLKQDHLMIASYFEKIEASDINATQTREGLFAQLKYELETHATVEEKLFYPRLEINREDQNLVREAIEEHALFTQLLAELATMSITDPEWMPKLVVLKENVSHHVDEEEDELFEIARKNLDEKQLQELGERIEREKQTLAGGEKPSRQQSRQNSGDGQSNRQRQRQNQGQSQTQGKGQSQGSQRPWQSASGSRSAEQSRSQQRSAPKRQGRG